MNTSDTILLQQWASQKDASAFTELVSRHTNMVYATSRRILRNETEAHDVTQDCMVELMDSASSIKTSPPAWLHRVAVNRSLDRLKKDHRRWKREKTYSDALSSAEPHEWDDVQEIIDECIDDLPESTRELIVMRFLESLKLGEIADQLALPESTVRYRIKKGVTDLRQLLSKRGLAIPAATFSTMLLSKMVQAAPISLITQLKKVSLIGNTSGGSTFNWPIPKSLVVGSLAVAIVVIGGISWFQQQNGPGLLESGAATPNEVFAVEDTNGQPTVNDPSQRIVLAKTKDNEQDSDDIETPMSQINITCIDEQGKTVSGAEVYVRFYHHSGDSIDPEGRLDLIEGPVTTDDSGVVLIDDKTKPGYERSGYVAYARVPGKWVGVTVQDDQESKELRVLMVPSQTIKGIVRTSTNVLPNDLKIRVQRFSVVSEAIETRFPTSFSSVIRPYAGFMEEVFVVKPDGFGKFSIKDMPVRGRVVLSAEAKGFEFFQKSIDTLDDAPIELLVRTEGTIEGRVIEKETGNPAADVLVYAQARIGMPTIYKFSTRSDSQGWYRIGGLSANDEYRVHATPTKFPADWVSAAITDVSVKNGETTDGIDLAKEKGAIISGTVTERESGQPVRDVVIVAMNPVGLGSLNLESVTTKADGKYAMRVPEGSSYTYIGSWPKHIKRLGNLSKREFTIGIGEEFLDNMDYVLEKDPKGDSFAPPDYATVNGKVLGTDGNPLADIQVGYYRYYKREDMGDWGDGNYRQTFSDADGNYEMKIIAFGKYNVYIGGAGGYSRHKSTEFVPKIDEQIEISPGIVWPLTGSISARVIDVEGNPVNDAPVSIRGRKFQQQTTTDPDGRFSFKNIASGMVEIHIYKSDVFNKSFTVMSDQHHEFILVPYDQNPSRKPNELGSRERLIDLGKVFADYTEDHDGYYPPLTPYTSYWTPDWSALYPNYVDDAAMLLNPDSQFYAADYIPLKAALNKKDIDWKEVSRITSRHHTYLGWSVRHEGELQVLIDARKKWADTSQQGDFTAGDVTLYRLREGIEEFFVDWAEDEESLDYERERLLLLSEYVPEFKFKRTWGSIEYLNLNLTRRSVLTGCGYPVTDTAEKLLYGTIADRSE